MTYFTDWPTGQWRTIYADPPWLETGAGVKGGKRGADRHYPLMKSREIAAMPVRDLVGRDAHLYLWTTNSFLPDALEVVKAWGFDYRSLLTWGKVKADGSPAIGLGQYYRGASEHVIFAIRGVIPYRHLPDGRRAQGRTLVLHPRSAHSVKPEKMRKMIEVVSPGPYLELFARAEAEGWDAWGNEENRQAALL